MSGSIKLGIYILLAVILGYFAFKLVLGVLSMAIPILIVAGIALVIFGVVSRKALGGSRRTLP